MHVYLPCSGGLEGTGDSQRCAMSALKEPSSGPKEHTVGSCNTSALTQAGNKLEGSSMLIAFHMTSDTSGLW